MPKERFHIHLAARLARECEPPPPDLFDRAAFLIGALSPDIFYYDLPLFSLSPVGDWLHALIEREGISPVCDWILKGPLEEGNSEAISWGLGVATHFMADALYHPLIEELSSGGLGRVYRESSKLSPVERHRLLESEIEAFGLARTPGSPKSDYLQVDVARKRGRLSHIASHYLRFLRFAAAAAKGGVSAAPARLETLSPRRITRCFLWQNFLLKLFANTSLGLRRDSLLLFPSTRFLGALVAPARPVLPDLFARATPEHRNPFSDSFLERADSSFRADWRSLIGKIWTGKRQEK